MAVTNDRADIAIEASIARADKAYVVGVPQLAALLSGADADLTARLSRIQKAHGGPSGKYTEEAARLSLEQVKLVQAYVGQRLLGLTHNGARKAIGKAFTETVGIAKRLEAEFTGITKPLNIEQAGVFDPHFSEIESSMLSRNESSVERYSEAIVRQFEQVMQRGFIAGMTNREVIRRMVSNGGKGGINADQLAQNEPNYFPKPTGYMRKQYWAERIVRTETAYAYNKTSFRTVALMQAVDFPDIHKKILATFDNRTAPDSIAVHGQIRKPGENFLDGAGRSYLHPPARPNDRETVIPWRMAWPETAGSRPVPPKEAAEAAQAAAPAARDHGQPVDPHKLKKERLRQRGDLRRLTESKETELRAQAKAQAKAQAQAKSQAKAKAKAKAKADEFISKKSKGGGGYTMRTVYTKA